MNNSEKNFGRHAQKGNIPWNKGKKASEKTLRKLVESHRGKYPSEETRKRMSEAQKKIGNRPPNHKGKKRSSETIQRMSDSKRGIKNGMFGKRYKKDPSSIIGGSRHYLWKGGITPINKKLRSSNEAKIWRRAVLERDGYICIWCGAKDKLEADHIKRWSDYPELRFAIDNGRTLCKPCRRTTNTWGNKR